MLPFFSTILLQNLPSEQWYFLIFSLLIIPVICAILFLQVKLPEMETLSSTQGVFQLGKNKAMLLCLVLIFFGGASENIISQWSSSYLEQVLHLPKIWGDMLGVALFATMLGLGRTLYAKRGKNILKTMILGAMMTVVCYVVLIFMEVAIVGVLACAFSGYCVSMLWPGSILLVQDRVPQGGIVMFALMAAGGDLGAALAPQIVGIVADFAISYEFLVDMGIGRGYSLEQIGMKCGMLVALIFPVILSVILIWTYVKEKRGKVS